MQTKTTTTNGPSGFDPAQFLTWLQALAISMTTGHSITAADFVLLRTMQQQWVAHYHSTQDFTTISAFITSDTTTTLSGQTPTTFPSQVPGNEINAVEVNLLIQSIQAMTAHLHNVTDTVNEGTTTVKNTSAFTSAQPPLVSVVSGQTIAAGTFVRIVAVLMEQVSHVHSFADNYQDPFLIKGIITSYGEYTNGHTSGGDGGDSGDQNYYQGYADGIWFVPVSFGYQALGSVADVTGDYVTAITMFGQNGGGVYVDWLFLSNRTDLVNHTLTIVMADGATASSTLLGYFPSGQPLALPGPPYQYQTNGLGGPTGNDAQLWFAVHGLPATFTVT